MNEIVKKTQGLIHIELLEKCLKELPQFEQKLRHFTEVDGIYIREFYMPAGTLVTGKVHVNESYSILTKGRVSVANDSDEQFIMQAGDIRYSKPGSKKAVFSLEESLFITVHKCDLKEIDDIEQFLAVDTIEDYQKRIAS